MVRFARIRVLSSITTGALLTLSVAAPMGAQSAGIDRTTSVAQSPPGNSGYIDDSSFSQAQMTGDCHDLGPHICDWLTGYRDFRFRDATLFDRSNPGPNDTSTTPVAGVKIVRTPDGVAHVFGSKTDSASARENVAYGAGVVAAQDRLFEAELFRRAAEGRLSALLGPDYVAYDAAWRRETESPKELMRLFHKAPSALRNAVRSYVAGMNSVIDQVNADPSTAPVEFKLLSDYPVPKWRARDTIEIAVLMSKSFGEDGGHELQHAILGERLLRI